MKNLTHKEFKDHLISKYKHTDIEEVLSIIDTKLSELIVVSDEHQGHPAARFPIDSNIVTALIVSVVNTVNERRAFSGK